MFFFFFFFNKEKGGKFPKSRGLINEVVRATTRNVNFDNFYGGRSKLPTLLVKPKSIKQRVWRLIKGQLKNICAAFSTKKWILYFLLIHKNTYIYKAVIPEFLSS